MEFFAVAVVLWVDACVTIVMALVIHTIDGHYVHRGHFQCPTEFSGIFMLR